MRRDDDRELGWCELKTNEFHPADETLCEELAHAVAAWRASTPELATEAVGTVAAPASWPEPTPEQAPEPAWDLVWHHPGSQLYGQVAAAHAAGERPTFWRRLALGKRAYSTWERGLIGEQLVGAELRRLVTADPRWGYPNSIPVGASGSDIDHLVVGPGGVFTINTKYHSGCTVWVGGDTVMINGQRQPYVRNARFEAKRATALLTRACGYAISVRALIVPVQAANFTVREQPADLDVVPRNSLVDFLWQQPVVLHEVTIRHVFEQARLSTTWTAAKR